MIRILCGSVATVIFLALYAAAFRDAGYRAGLKASDDAYKEGHKNGWKTADNWWIETEASTEKARRDLWREQLHEEKSRRQWP